MKYYVVDAFTDQKFSGNPAGVCVLDHWLDDLLMQKIAFENNLAETAFLVKKEGCYELRWFTPEVEIDLCGHATLASAFILMNMKKELQEVTFNTKSGILKVKRDEDKYLMDFPSRKPVPCEIPPLLEAALGVRILGTFLSRDLLVLVEKESDVIHVSPDFSMLKKIDAFAFVVTAKGTTCDFVSRFFVPNAGIDEDPVTGSSHSTLIPFWSERLHKTEMTAKQLSKRGGMIYCKDCGPRVEIGGKAVLYLIGDIIL